MSSSQQGSQNFLGGSPQTDQHVTQSHSDTYTQHNENTDSTSSYQFRFGFSEDQDPILNWQPENTNSTSSTTSLVNINTEDDNSLPAPLITSTVPLSDAEGTAPESNRGSDSEEPPAKMRRINSPNKSVDDLDGETCPICLDTWSNSGEHRLVALKCGHLFGAKCVERWLRAQSVRDRSCPTCKSRATIKEIRHIYARRLIAADTAEITALQEKVERLESEKSRSELELQKTKMAHRACLAQLESLRNSIPSSSQERGKTGWRFALEKNLEISKDGGCRVLAYNCRSYDLFVSQKSTNSLFPGYGVRRVSCVDYKLGQFIHLHPRPIRDITYSQPRDLLMSVSLDGAARLVERGIASMTIQNKSPLWSCAWNVDREHELFVGGLGGAVTHYDIRNTGSPLGRICAAIDMTPVAAICSTEHGLLSLQLNSCTLWQHNVSTSQWDPKELPVEGPFLSMCYDSQSRRAVVSCRPKGNERAKLVVNKLNTDSNSEVLCDVEQTFNGSFRASLMCRAAYVRAGTASWVAAHSESEGALFLHGLEGARTMSLPAFEPALDVCSAQLNGDTILTGLSECRLRIYKAVPSHM